MTPPDPSSQARHLAQTISNWFESSARDLPWRRTDPKTGLRNPYFSLVSEFMLQQTQVSRVLEKFGPFVRRFPTIQALAAAHEQDVLAAWSGLGYYRRAKLLHSAAIDIVNRFEGVIPASAAELQSITGIGPYTAGAIASIVFHQPAPIVDGNVARVLMRLRADGRSAADREANTANWSQATELVEAAPSPALTNEGVMELGALICTPKSPRCLHCPLRAFCRAADAGIQDTIPAPKRPATRSTVYHTAVRIIDRSGRLLIQRRPASGLWASMWQAPTAESVDSQPKPSVALKPLGLRCATLPVAVFVHVTSHRTVEFAVHEPTRPLDPERLDQIKEKNTYALISPKEIGDLPLANPHRRILAGLTHEVS